MSGDVTVRQALAQSGLVPLDAQVLLAHVLTKDRGWLIAHGRSRAAVLATDASADALVVARENARRLAIANVDFAHADWYASLPPLWNGAQFDLIASNPPYVAAQDPHLREGDVRFEPVS